LISGLVDFPSTKALAGFVNFSWASRLTSPGGQCLNLVCCRRN